MESGAIFKEYCNNKSMFQKIINFIKYHNAFSIILVDKGYKIIYTVNVNKFNFLTLKI